MNFLDYRVILYFFIALVLFTRSALYLVMYKKTRRRTSDITNAAGFTMVGIVYMLYAMTGQMVSVVTDIASVIFTLLIIQSFFGASNQYFKSLGVKTRKEKK